MRQPLFYLTHYTNYSSLARTHTLGKAERLKSRKLIDQLFNKGRTLVHAPFRVQYVIAPANGKAGTSFGVSVPTRNFKKATDRNRVKRLLREAWRLQKISLDDQLRELDRQLLVFIIYTGRDIPDFELVKEKTGGIILKLSSVIGK